MSDVADVLERAAERVERGWCRYVYAKDENGDTVPLHSDRATRWCAIGAIAASDDGSGTYHAECALRLCVGDSVSVWNDAHGRTQAEVVAALREAARRARESKP